MESSRGLSNRLLRAFLLQAAYISVAAVVGVFAASILLEEVLIQQALEGEAAYYWERHEGDRSFPLPQTRNMTGYMGPDVPDILRAMPPGKHAVPGEAESIAYVTERDGVRLYLVFDGARVDELATFFGLIPLAVVLVAIYLALYLAYRISRRAVSPVIALAHQVQRFDPEAPDPSAFSLESPPANPDDEIRLLADAMAGFTQRLAAFVERERNFTRDASHELRSPLTVIRIASDMLLSEQKLAGPAETSVRRIRRAAKDMEELTEAFLLLARETEQELRHESVSVNQVVRGEVESCRILAGGKPVTIAVEESRSLFVVAPERVLASVIGNLLRNGLSYTDEGRIDVSVDRDGVTVADSGQGMAEKDVEHVFEPFYRGQRKRGGHGVGLTIVKRLCDRFGWQVRIDSTLGVGTRVRVRFPEARIEAGPGAERAVFTRPSHPLADYRT